MKVVVHGSYFGYNFGDTLLCRIFSDWARSVDGVDEVILPLADAANRKYIGGDKSGFLRALSADRAIFCGGGYFSAPNASRAWQIRAFWRHLALAEALQMRGVPIALLGVGVGPLHGKLLKARVVRLFEYAKIVVVRDEQSRQYLTDLGLKRDVLVRTDAALSMDLSRFDLASCNLLSKTDPSFRRLLVHTTATPDARELAIVSYAAKWADGKRDVQLILGTDSRPRRARVVWPSDLMETLNKSKTLVYKYPGDVDNLISLLSSVDGIVTTKLHVGIVGSVLEKFVVSVPHHTKTPRFYSQINLEQNCVPPHAQWEAPLQSLLDDWYSGSTLDFSALRNVRMKSDYLPFISAFIH
ncbi:polysaccharide pyruvyl transferase family protein [Pannonibacter carbonis]|uniref:polysaccharide pyruvyl transferase family protein n=1 Tax=Pannonibacter carbonis TaxID=2067569 RepID=UPI000D0ED1BB|nr:polysaccharide pyruvyl transferase family protein [Pannonibacter carbonis]